MSWIPDYVQAFCTKHNLINPTPCGSEWSAQDFETKKWVDVPNPTHQPSQEQHDIETHHHSR